MSQTQKPKWWDIVGQAAQKNTLQEGSAFKTDFNAQIENNRIDQSNFIGPTNVNQDGRTTGGSATSLAGYSQFNPGVTPVNEVRVDEEVPGETAAEKAARIAAAEAEAKASRDCAARGGVYNTATKTCDITTSGGGGLGTGGAAGTGDGGSTPVEGDVKRGEGDQILRFDGTSWKPINQGSTREFQMVDPNAPVPGADANVPINKYMESLGTDTLAGQAYSEALARRLASIDEQQLSAGQTYGDMYEQARMSQARRRGVSDTTGMTGGMADQLNTRVSAAEMASLGQIGMGREATMRQLERQELDAPMAAFEEGRQIEAYERSKQMMDRELAQAETLFEQAQSGWMQDPETGQWTNMDKEMQDSISLQAINARQRGEILGEMQYWQAILADPGQAALHEGARTALGELQTRYGTLLTNSSVITGRPNTPGSEGPQLTPEPEPEPTWQSDFTAGTLEQNATTFIATKLPTVGLTAADDLPGFRPGIRTDNDLAQSIYNLAGNRAVEGYDFATEIALVNKAAKNSDTLTSAEFNQLKAAGIYGSTQQYHNLFDIGIPTNTSDLRGQTVRFPQNDLMKSFMTYLVNTGTLTENDVARSLRNNVYNISALDSRQQPRFPQILDEFARWNETGRMTQRPETLGLSPVDIYG